MNEAIILAGGFGTRLYPMTQSVPKPMLPVGDRPFLEYLLERLSMSGFSRVVLSVGYLGEQIESHFGQKWQNLDLIYIYEQAPLGTGGAIALALTKIESDYALVLNGDTFCAVDWQAIGQFHEDKQADLTIVLKTMHNFERYGNVIVDNDCVISFAEKCFVSLGQINVGVYVINKSLFATFLMPEIFSFETDILQQKLSDLIAVAFLTEGYFIDIGVLGDYDRAQLELPSNLKVETKNLST